MLLPSLAAAQNFGFRAPASPADPRTAAVMKDLAERIIPVYHDADQERFLDNLSALQLAAGSFESAYSARTALLKLRQGNRRLPPIAPSIVYDLFAHAKALQEQYRLAFQDALGLAFWEFIPILDNLDGFRVESWLERPVGPFKRRLAASFDRVRGRPQISEAQALRLIWQYDTFEAYRSFAAFVPGLVSLDDDRRYIIENHIEIPLSGGLRVRAELVRPRVPSGLKTTLLQYRIMPGGGNEAIEAAAYGFASMVAYTPRIPLGRGGWEVVPFEHEGEHARAVIRWVAKQRWSDAQLGMYGRGYSGFAAWAAAKHLLPEVKAISTIDAIAPGIDFPMDGNIELNSAYCWLENLEALRAQGAARAPLGRRACLALGRKWFASGKPYRDLPLIAGKPSAIFERWLAHPGYDDYWRHMAPSPRQFSRIDVPVLSLTGYFARGEAGTLFYFLNHHRDDRNADHTLLIGPYDKHELRRGLAQPLVRGYRTDPVALVNLRTLQLEWLSYLFFNTRKPSLLTDEVDYELMGANRWGHASSLAEGASAEARLYLGPGPAGGAARLSWRRPLKRFAVGLTVDLASRRDARPPPRRLLAGRVPLENGIAFVSDPLPVPLGIAGRISGLLRLSANKVDYDLALSLYELLPDGRYLRLFAPAEAFRASYLRDRSRRHLLAAGAAQWLMFTSERFTAVRLVPGSRLVLVLAVNRRYDEQINHGSGDAVSDEWAGSGGVPLRLVCHRGSFINLPLRAKPPTRP